LNIVISPYLGGESSEFNDIWYPDANFDPGDGNVTKFRNSQIQDGGRMLHIVRLR